jgi:large subunit ribosomal protein L9
MQVILLERIGRLGQMGDVVTVKDGFARNFLLSQGKALRATKANRERFERDRTQLEARNLELKSEAQAVATKLGGQGFIVIRQAGDSGQLYGSVTTRDIATVVTEGGFSIERRQVLLDRPIKTLGLHEVRIGLHAEVEPHVVVNVARSPDEAIRQARGEQVTGKAMDEAQEAAEAARRAAEQLFEAGALADELAEDAEEAEDAAPSETPS